MNTDLDNFFSVKAEKLYTQIVNQFVDLIKRGEFKPGQKLPSERQLSQKLEVSRTSLREAMIALQMMGVVVIKPNQGTYIADKKVPPILKEVTYLNLGESPFQILQARKAIEPNIAAIAASFRDQNSLREIENVLDQVESRVYVEKIDVSEYNDRDCAFHLAIAKATHNPILIGIGYVINNLMKQELWMTLISNTTSSSQIGQETGFCDHEEIFKAIQHRKPQVASAAMRTHLIRVEKIAKEADLLDNVNIAAKKTGKKSGDSEDESLMDDYQELFTE